VAIKVRDLAACERFYAGELGLRVVARPAGPDGAPRSIWLDCGDGALLMLERGEGGPDAAPLADEAAGLHLIALRIPRAERDGWAARLAVVAATPYTLYVRDPEGNRVGLSHHPEP
jgi:catechol 2,3-dioxygenase-like lactoylglutathione lyase family enzyme